MLENDTDNEHWRVHWAAAVALVRAVGHVLKNVDATNDLHVKDAADAAHKRWKSGSPEHEIFRNFIEKERNNLLKEYRTDVHPSSDVMLAFQLVARNPKNGDEVVFQDVGKFDENIYRPMLDGPWEGNDARDVLEIAIAWWVSELDAIDADAHRLKASR